MDQTIATAQSEFWSTVAKKYDRVVDLQIGPKTRGLLRERLTREDTLGNVVEFGCGTGFYTGTLATKSERVTATDLSKGMLVVAREHVRDANVQFQIEDCQRTSFEKAEFDTALISLVLHFTRPELVLNELRRILKPGGLLIICNLDLEALTGFDRVRCRARIVFHGLARYRTKPPKHFSDHMLTQEQLCELLGQCGFKVMHVETFKDSSRSSYIPVEYIRAERV
jgi:ubiquinone/menaquinone biosynthesis C-methylase UbiE